jgi:hypothetical protein
LESLVCIACQECAFCVPKYGGCWPSGGGKINNFRRHLPTKTWTAELDARLKDPNVMAQLQCQGFKVNGQKMKRQKYCELLCPRIPEVFCPMLPECGVKADALPPPKRQCTIQICPDAYAKDIDVTNFTNEDKERLSTLNELWCRHANKQKSLLSTMEDVQHTSNAGDYLRRQLRWYCEFVLGILVPRHGKAAFAYCLRQYTQPITAQQHKDRELMLDTMVKIYKLTPSTELRRVTFAQLCAMSPLVDLNARIIRVCEKNKESWGYHNNWCPDLIKRRRYQAAGKPSSLFIKTHS